jgi:hypothetical protein
MRVRVPSPVAECVLMSTSDQPNGLMRGHGRLAPETPPTLYAYAPPNQHHDDHDDAAASRVRPHAHGHHQRCCRRLFGCRYVCTLHPILLASPFMGLGPGVWRFRPRTLCGLWVPKAAWLRCARVAYTPTPWTRSRCLSTSRSHCSHVAGLTCLVISRVPMHARGAQMAHNAPTWCGAVRRRSRACV